MIDFGNHLRSRACRLSLSACLATLALGAALPAGAIAGPAPKGTFSFSASSYDANEKDGSVVVTVTRTPNKGPATVHFATSNGTATAGTDYVAVSTTLSFKSGQSSKTVSVTVLDDSVASEPTETVNLGLDQPSKGYTAGASAVLNIHEDPPPAAPGNLQVTGSDPYDVSLGWDSSTGATGYAIYRSTTTGTGYTQIGTTAGATSFTDGAAVSGTTYYYVVQATNDDGTSGNSSEANGTTSGTNLLTNGNFESGDFTGWTTGVGSCVGPCHNAWGALPAPSIDSGSFLGGSYSAFLGQPTNCFTDGSGQAYMLQVVAVPGTGTTVLTWYYNGQADDSLGWDGQQVVITNPDGTTLIATPQNTEDNSRTWTRQTYDLSAQAGNSVRILFRVYSDGSDFRSCTGMNVDNVSVVNS